MNIGDTLPPVTFETTSGVKTSFDRYQGSWLVLYFYPKDSTPGCTIESCDFRDNEKSFAIFNATILGVSRDSLSSHERFKTKQRLPFELISDSEEELCQLFDVIKVKSMFGLKTRGVERSTFLIDPNGVIRHIWRKVSVKGHVDDVLTILKQLQ